MNTFYAKTQGLRNRHFLLIHLCFALITPALALYFRLDGRMHMAVYGQALLLVTILFATVKLPVFYGLGMYKRYWNRASVDYMGRLIYIATNTMLVQFFIFVMCRSIPVSYCNNFFTIFLSFPNL